MLKKIQYLAITTLLAGFVFIVIPTITSISQSLAQVENPAPTITSISPISRTTGEAEFILTVNGTNFISTSIVQFASSSRTTYYSSASKLTALFQLSDLTTAGTFNIAVFNPTPGGGISNIKAFTVNNPVATTTSISPTSKFIGDAGFTLEVKGTNFISKSVIQFNGSTTSVPITQFINSTKLTAFIPVNNLTTKRTFNVTVFNPTPGGGASNAQIFSVNEFIGGTTCGVSGQGRCKKTCGAYDEVIISNTISGGSTCPASEQCCVKTNCSDNETGFSGEVYGVKFGGCVDSLSCDEGYVGLNTSDCLPPKLCCVNSIGNLGNQDSENPTTVSPGSNESQTKTDQTGTTPSTGETAEQDSSSKKSEWLGLVPCQGVKKTEVRSADGKISYTYETDCTLCSFLKFFQNLITYFTELIFALAGGFIVWGAIEIMTSGGSEERVKDGKNRVTVAIYGIAIALAAFLLVGTVFQFLTNSKSAVPWNKIDCSSSK